MSVASAVILTALITAIVTILVYRRLQIAPAPTIAFPDLDVAAVLVNQEDQIAAMTPRLEELLGIKAVDYLHKPYGNLIHRLEINSTKLKSTGGTNISLLYNDRVLEPNPTGKVSINGQRHRLIVFHDVTHWNQPHITADGEARLDTLRRVYGEIAGTLNIQAVMMLSLDTGLRLSGASAGFIALVNDDGDMEVAQHIGSYDIDLLNRLLKERRGIAGRVMQRGEPELILDVTQDPDYAGLMPRTRALMNLPLKNTEDNFVGLLALETPYPHRFNRDVYQFIQLLSNRIAAAILNARLYRQVQAQLEELQKNHARISYLEQLKTDMIRIAAHDLRDPLGAILLHLQLLERTGTELDPNIQRMVQNVRESAERMNKIVQNILSLERIETIAWRALEDAEPVDLQHQAKSALGYLRPRAEEKQLVIQQNLDGHSEATVRGEATQLYEAMSNLISNAIKYTPKAGTVDIRLQAENGHVVFTVEDSGYGIPSEMQSRLFQPFYRAETKENRHIEGTGLGLHLVKNIVERHGGVMIFHSEYGKGSTFGFRLPAANKNHPHESV